MRDASVMLAHDFHPERHQGGVGIIQNNQFIYKKTCFWSILTDYFNYFSQNLVNPKALKGANDFFEP